MSAAEKQGEVLSRTESDPAAFRYQNNERKRYPCLVLVLDDKGGDPSSVNFVSRSYSHSLPPFFAARAALHHVHKSLHPLPQGAFPPGISFLSHA